MRMFLLAGSMHDASNGRTSIPSVPPRVPCAPGDQVRSVPVLPTHQTVYVWLSRNVSVRASREVSGDPKVTHAIHPSCAMRQHRGTRAVTVLSDAVHATNSGFDDPSSSLKTSVAHHERRLPRRTPCADTAAAGVGCRAVSDGCYLVDPASSHMLVSKIKPCMCKYELIQTVKLRMAH